MLHLRGCKLTHLKKVFSTGYVCHGDIHVHLNRQRAVFDRDEQTQHLGRVFQNGYGQIGNIALLTAFVETYTWSYGELNLENIIQEHSEDLWGEKHLWAMLTQRSLFGVKSPEEIRLGWIEAKELHSICNHIASRQTSPNHPEIKEIDRIFRSAYLEKKDILSYNFLSHLNQIDQKDLTSTS